MSNYQFRFLFLFSAVFFSCSMFAQVKKIDSLEQEIKKSNLSVEQQLEINMQLSSLLTQNETRKALPYITKAIELAEKLKDPNKIGLVYQQRGIYHEKTGSFKNGLDDLAKAITYVDKSSKGQELFITSNVAKGGILRRQSKYEESMSALQEANKVAETLKNDTLLYATYTQLGVLSVTMKDLDRASEYHNKALAKAVLIKSDKRIAKTYQNMGIICREKEQHKEGIDLTEKALTYAYKSGDSTAISTILNELGALYDRDGQCQKATPYLLKAIGIKERTKEENELAYAYFYMGSNMSGLGRVKESEEWMKKSLKQAQKIQSTKQIIDAYQMMYINFRENKKSDSALEYLRKFIKLRDSVSGLEVKEKIEELNIKYESQKKDLNLKEEKLKNIYLLSGIGLLLLSFGLLFSAFVQRKLKHKNELQQTLMREQDKATKEIIDAEENERQRIASDLHDGVGQYMTVAKMNLEVLGETLNFKNEKESELYQHAIHLVSDSVSEVRTISHNMMPNALLKNGLGKAVRSFLDNLNQQKIKVQLFTDGLNVPIDSNIEIFLYRIIQECVNNVLKHANASELNISILANVSEIDVNIEDNGKGFNPEAVESKEGIGISNMQKRVQFLKGTIHWDSTSGNGTMVMIHVPLNKG